MVLDAVIEFKVRGLRASTQSLATATFPLLRFRVSGFDVEGLGLRV